MGDHSPGDHTTNLANTIRGLKKFDGRNPAEFKGWMKKLCVVLGVTRRDILPLLKDEPKPAETDTAAYAAYCKSNEDLYAILYLLVELPAALSVQKHEDDNEISGDGQAAFRELNNNYNKVTDEVIRATMEELVNTPMEPGQNPDDYFNQKHLLRHKVEKMGETISDRYFKDICVTGFTDEYKDVKMIMYRDPDFNVDQMQTTMRHMFLDEQSRNGSKGGIAGRGFAMATTTSKQRACFGCGESGHTKRNCPRRRKTKPAGAAKWCCVHFTTRHSDEECYEQGAKRPEKSGESGKAFSACTHCTHCSSASNKQEPATAKESSSKKSAIDFSADGDESDEGFMYATTNNGKELKANAAGATLLVDTGATETMLDDRLIPRLKEIMREYKQLVKPKAITVAGDHELKGTATGVVHCTVKDSRGEQQDVRLRGLIVPGLGRNIFSPTALMKKGVRLIVEAGNPHLAVGDYIIPLKQNPRDMGMCSLDIEFQAASREGATSTMPTQHALTEDRAFGKPDTVSGNDDLGVAYAAKANADTWHRRLGHLNSRSMDILRKKDGNGVDFADSMSPCDICAISKSRQLAHPKKTTRKTTAPMQLVYTDNMGQISPPAKGGFRYVSKFTDDFSRMKEVYLLKAKSESVRALHAYNMHVAARLGRHIEIVRCDRGGENIGNEFTTYCTDSGITIEYAATNTPQQNGVSERDGQTLTAITRCLMKDGAFPSTLWGELMLTAVYLSNRSPHAALGGATPYFKMYGKEADLSGLRVIGARAFVHHERYTKKLSDRAFEGKLCGFSQDSKAYRIYNPATGNVVESRNVTFIETPAYSMPLNVPADDFFYEGDVLSFTSLLGGESAREDTFDGWGASDTTDYQAENALLRQEIRRMRHNNVVHEELQERAVNTRDGTHTGDDTSANSPNPPLPSDDGPAADNGGDEPGVAPVPARGTSRPLEVTRASTRRRPNASDTVDAALAPSSLTIDMDDSGGACMTAVPMRPDPSALTSAQLLSIAGQTTYDYASTAPDFAHLDEESLPKSRAYVYATGTPIQQGFLEEERRAIKIPNTFKEAINSPEAKQWEAAIGKEMASLAKHKVYKMVPIDSVPKDEKILGTRFVFKQKADGSLKVRLVVQGHVQESGIDYGRSYAPVCRIGSVRTLLAIACEHGWPVWQMDVCVAFLQSEIDKDVWVKPAPGQNVKDPVTGDIMVYKLERSLYGLAQSPVLWYDTIDEVLVVIGFRPTQSDPCVYIHGRGDTLVILTLYVDDILISGKDPELVANLKTELRDRFEMKDMGEVSHILGMEVTRNYEEGTLAVSQKGYVKNILERFGMENCNPVSTPGYGPELSTDQPADKLLGAAESKMYQSITGSLLYLAQCTRYDLCYAVNQLTRACSKPAQAHMTAAKHALRYLRGKPDLPIVFKRGQFRIAAFADASFGANPDNRKSTTGYLFFLGGGLISFGTKTQSLTAQSTVESELQAISYGAKEAVYLSNLLLELKFDNFKPISIKSDSSGALSLAANSMFSSRTKHIALRFFFLRELIKRRRITVHHVPTQAMLADIATKYLDKHKFNSILQQIEDFKC